MSGNHNDPYETLNVDFKWTVADEAIQRGYNYASATEPLIRTELRGISIHAILKNAYQEGFMHGFAHKFDDHGYKEN